MMEKKVPAARALVANKKDGLETHFMIEKSACGARTGAKQKGN